ncbi:MAG: hypothetical protein IPN79_07520 [Saprospiraceae bacterium]|nr:hypothetical protein [Saprospiraceae bacterium]
MLSNFYTFCSIFILSSGFYTPDLKAEKIFYFSISQDTTPSLKIIQLSSKNNLTISTLCANKVVETLCELNELYLNENISFTITDSGIPDFMVDSVLSFPIEKGSCKVFYDKENIDKKISVLRNKTEKHKQIPAFSRQLEVTKPTENTTVYYKDIVFAWPENPEINHYVLDVAMDAQFTKVVKSIFVFGNQIKLDHLDKNELYYWRLKPLHQTQYCQEYRAEGKFFTVDIHVKTMSLFGISLYTIGPTTFFVNNPDHKWYTIEIESLEGKMISQIESNASHKIFDADAYQPGHYFVRLRFQTFDNTTILTVR